MKNEYYIAKRDELLKQLPYYSLTVLSSNEILYGNGDEVLPYVQNHDFLYLTGIRQNESRLLLYKGENEYDKEIVLYLTPSNLKEEIWSGTRLDAGDATLISGIKMVKDLPSFQDDLILFSLKVKMIYLNSNEHLRSKARNFHYEKILQEVKKACPFHPIKRLAPFLSDLREVKNEQEIFCIEKAVEITRRGYLKILPLIKEGICEKDLEAELAYEFIKSSKMPTSQCFAFAPIIAGGKNTCILHYEKNNQILKAGELLLIDIGARYQDFNADLTRVFPINGKFNVRQKDVYKAVLKALKESIKLFKPRLSFLDYKKQSLEIMKESILSLNLLSAKEIGNYQKYFMHGLSHFLGMGVHDSGSYEKIFKEGMVLTCEPGIYIREEGLGIRLEEDILITNNGCRVLSKNMPIDLEEIEDLMNLSIAKK